MTNFSISAESDWAKVSKEITKIGFLSIAAAITTIATAIEGYQLIEPFISHGGFNNAIDLGLAGAKFFSAASTTLTVAYNISNTRERIAALAKKPKPPTP